MGIDRDFDNLSRDYPVTRMQAVKCLRRGDRLEVDFKETEAVLQVMIRWQSLPKGIACRFWSGPGTLWLQLNWKQLLGFIKRNYPRQYPIG